MNDWQIEEVTFHYYKAKENLSKAKAKHDKAVDRLKKMTKVMECDHPADKLVSDDGFILNTERCEACGYEWHY